MPELSTREIEINSSSYVDPNGFVFKYKGQLLRAINCSRESFYTHLFQESLIEKLSRNFNFVYSEITDYTIPEINCNLVLKHDEIKPLTYCTDWCPSMLKEAGIITLKLNLALLDHDCYLQDAYPWNVLFDFTKPVFVDFTSIVPIKDNLLWPAYQQFINFFVNPLNLSAMGKGNIARLFLFDYINGINLKDFNSNLTTAHLLKHPLASFFYFISEGITDRIQNNTALKIKFQQAMKSHTLSKYNKDVRKRFFERLLKKFAGIKLKKNKTTWADYYSNIDINVNIKNKEDIIEKFLAELNPSTVLDLGSNTGKFSIIASNKNAKVISIDSSERCVEELYYKTIKNGYRILPIVGDILCPAPSYGFLSTQFSPLVKRIKSEVVLCLGLMHHLHINGRQTFDRIALLLNELSEKAIIFEYIDTKDDNINLLDHGREINYSMKIVIDALAKYFKKIEVTESDRESRKMLLCRK